MIQVSVISGFLGAGKTTLIRKLISEAFKGEKVILLENEYGEVGIDGGFMKDSGIQVTELNSGCICCTLVGDFHKAIDELIATYAPERIIIEPSGVGKLSEIRAVVEQAKERHPLNICGCATVVDGQKCRMYIKNFGEFFTDQVKSAETVILSRTQFMKQEKLDQAIALIREINPDARIITTPWDELDGKKILETIEHPASLIDIFELYPEAGHHHDDDEDEEEEHQHHHHHHDEDEDEEEEHEHHHHHHDDDDDGEEEHEHHHHHHDEDEDEEEEHEHHHHHDEDDEEEEHEHHHHDEDDEEEEHEHHHHDEDEGDGETRVIRQSHHHHHHHHHHEGELDADDVFENFGIETSHKFTEEGLRAALSALSDNDKYGFVLRSKGILPAEDGRWIHYDFVPEEFEIRYGCADYTGRMCVIGSGLKESEIRKLFGI